MEKAPEGKWHRRERMEAWLCITLSENKSNITGIQYEPWHIRYVGLPHSAIMQKRISH